MMQTPRCCVLTYVGLISTWDVRSGIHFFLMGPKKVFGPLVKFLQWKRPITFESSMNWVALTTVDACCVVEKAQRTVWNMCAHVCCRWCDGLWHTAVSEEIMSQLSAKVKQFFTHTHTHLQRERESHVMVWPFLSAGFVSRFSLFFIFSRDLCVGALNIPSGSKSNKSWALDRVYMHITNEK